MKMAGLNNDKLNVFYKHNDCNKIIIFVKSSCSIVDMMIPYSYHIFFSCIYFLKMFKVIKIYNWNLKKC
jgi:hypothetical protein